MQIRVGAFFSRAKDQQQSDTSQVSQERSAKSGMAPSTPKKFPCCDTNEHANARPHEVAIIRDHRLRQATSQKHASSEDWRCLPGSSCCEVADERDSLLAPPAPSFQGNDHGICRRRQVPCTLPLCRPELWCKQHHSQWRRLRMPGKLQSKRTAA